MSAERVLKVEATLGEGPVWFENMLWFVDIKQRHVHRFDPATGETKRWDAPEQVGWVLPSKGGIIAGLKTGVHRFDPEAGTFELLHDPEPMHPDNRLNDATTDSLGRLWFGSMDDGEGAATGHLYRHADGAFANAGLPPVSITNGPAVSADGRTLYHTDTLGAVIWRVPVGEDGSLGTPEKHIEIEAGAGHPDGSVVDAEGHLWVALWGGWGVRRYDPAGKLVSTHKLPASNITKIAFGGPDLRTAYATSARAGLDAAALADQPEAGNLFSFDPGVAGLPVTPANI